MVNNEFSYSNLQTANLPIVKDNAFAVTFPDSHYIGLFQNPSKESRVDLISRVGSVVYISLKEVADNVERGWNLLVDIFFEYHVTFVRLPKREYRLALPEEQGRQIAIYHYLNPSSLNLQDLQERIAAILSQGGIETSDVPVNTTPVLNIPHLFFQEDNMDEVQNQRQALVQQNRELSNSEDYFTPFARRATLDIPQQVDLPLALYLIRSHQIFYEIDRRLPRKFSFNGVIDEEGKHIEFDGGVLFAMKIADHALHTILGQ